MFSAKKPFKLEILFLVSRNTFLEIILKPITTPKEIGIKIIKINPISHDEIKTCTTVKIKEKNDRTKLGITLENKLFIFAVSLVTLVTSLPTGSEFN